MLIYAPLTSGCIADMAKACSDGPILTRSGYVRAFLRTWASKSLPLAWRMIWGEMVSPQFAIFARVNGNPRTPPVKQLRKGWA